ncbi:hypothetical protein [Cellulomonas sp. RIT-PI-Y]|uniref:hypothetical protein n=1 Tax=Cellulomonas sp. RIT-PI-Y TaxID=3035297 RepID=UPI003211E75E
MSHQTAAAPPASDEQARVEQQAAAPSRYSLGGAGMRNIGLIIALAVLGVIGYATSGTRFASLDNLTVIVSTASIVGVLCIGMTFVITAGGIDLSVGSVLGLASVWATTLATQSDGRGRSGRRVRQVSDNSTRRSTSVDSSGCRGCR